MVSRGMKVEELLEQLNSEEFDPIQVINDAVHGSKPVVEQHPESVEIMTLLDGYMQSMMETLQKSLEQLEKSAKRIPHEIELLKNDSREFNDRQKEKVPELSELADAVRQSNVLNELATLDEARRRLKQVQALLEAAKSPSEQSEEVQKQLSAVFAGTPVESKWISSSKNNYYGLFNKMIK